jgi:hypothetical protein
MTATDPAALRRSFYLLLTTVSVGIAAAKIVGAENVFEPSRYRPPSEKSYGADRDADYIPERVWPKSRPEPTPTFSSNDKSRWATIRALVDEGTYVVGRRANFQDKEGPWEDTGIIFLPDYQSLDKVMNPETGEFYSSKPPLMPTVLAGEYWLLKRILGWSIDRDRWYVMCTILLTVNVLPLVVYLILLSRLIDDYAASDFSRLLVFTTACCGTFLTTFSHTLNNHVPAAYCALFAVYPLLKKGGTPATESAGKLLTSGFFAGLTAALDLPAAALLAGLFVPLLAARPGKTLAYFLPAALVPVAALFACNYAALGRLLPAYGEFGGPWYNYPGSHWARLGTPQAKGIDFADEPKHVYALHMLFGHHGWFSLTPVWLLGAAGLGWLAWQAGPRVKELVATRKAGAGGVWDLPLFGAMTLAVSVVVCAFYVWRTNNYGGFTSGPRWLFWLTPLWLLGTLPAADRVGIWRAGRLTAAVLLGLSVLSVFYPAWNPWRPPWILQLSELHGWIRY